MNLTKAFGGAGPSSTQGMLHPWESEEGVHTPSRSKTPIVICGWLLKMKREHRKFRSTWNRRWFTVEDGAFHWYKTSSSDACGRLSLTDIHSVRRFDGGEHGAFTFVVYASNRDMLLRADTARDESRWIRGLTLQIDLVHGGTFQGPPSAKNRRRTVLRVAGDGGGDATVPMASSSKRRPGDWEGRSHFREVNDRIRATVDERGSSHVSSTEESGGAALSMVDATQRQQTTFSPVRSAKMIPRDPRGISTCVGGKHASSSTRDSDPSFGTADSNGGRNGVGAYDSSWRLWQSKVVPLSSDGAASQGDSRARDTHAAVGDERPRPTDDKGIRCGGGGDTGGAVARRLPPPSGPPPVNGRIRADSSSRKSRDARDCWGVGGGRSCRRGSDDANARGGVELGRGRCEGRGQGAPRQRPHRYRRRRNDGRRANDKALQKECRRSAGDDVRSPTSNDSEDRARRHQGHFDDLDDCSSDESFASRNGMFMDDASSANTDASSVSPIEERKYASASSRLPAGNRSVAVSSESADSSRDSSGEGVLRFTSSRLPGYRSAPPAHRSDGRNFDNDDESSREAPSIAGKAKRWLGADYASCGGALRASSGGSVTAEDSWSGGIARGYDDETPSTSRVGSSGRSSSRSSQRRYLMEQNKFRPRATTIRGRDWDMG